MGLAVAAALVGVTVGAVGMVATASGAAAPTCYSDRLRPEYGGPDNSAGHLGDRWLLRNVWTSTCSIKGFAGLTNYRSDGRPLPTTVSFLGSAATFTLAPGAAAAFSVQYRDPNIPPACTPQPATQMTILPPGSSHPVLVSRGEPACGGVLQETALTHS
jgi:hypothetical protein